MRTTLTLDDDVAAALDQMRKTRNISLKEAVNETLRSGLKEQAGPKKQGQPFRTRAFDVGRLLVDVTCISEALAIAEGEDYR
jgi:Arc/MetJ family transcription regulator